jgi:hypothetical protein
MLAAGLAPISGLASEIIGLDSATMGLTSATNTLASATGLIAGATLGSGSALASAMGAGDGHSTMSVAAGMGRTEASGVGL